MRSSTSFLSFQTLSPMKFKYVRKELVLKVRYKPSVYFSALLYHKPIGLITETSQVIPSDIQPYSPSPIEASSSSLGTIGGRAQTVDARLTSRSVNMSHGQVDMASVTDTPPHPPFLHLPLDTDPIWGPPPDHELQTAAHELKLTGRVHSPVAKHNKRQSQRSDCCSVSTETSPDYGAPVLWSWGHDVSSHRMFFDGRETFWYRVVCTTEQN